MWTVVAAVFVVLATAWALKPRGAPMAPDEWDERKFLPHGALERVAERLWIVRGQLSYPLPRVMTVFQLPAPGNERPQLLLHSPVAVGGAALAALEALGDVAVLVAPNREHYLDAARYKARYPEARLLAPRAVWATLADKKGVPVDGACEDELPGLGVDCFAIDGVGDFELVYALPLGGAATALVFCDLFFNLPADAGLFPRLLGSSGFFGVTRIGRWFVVRHRADLWHFVRRLARDYGENLAAITVCHGDPVVGADACGAALEEAAGGLGGGR